ncbi:pyridoxal phosphate-dependent transferase [Melampsora americana]|nr:pyridoxal phosphate-dependent transferase [Melampsora americana]
MTQHQTTPTLTNGAKNSTKKLASSLSPTQSKSIEPESNEEKRFLISRDFRSDTMTAPTEDMFEFMKKASIGDDVYGEDPVTTHFQEKIAQLTGKEAALFCVSGTMTNQLAIRTWLTQPPHSVLCDARAHIHNYEAGGIAFHSQATTIPVTPSNGHTITLEDIKPLMLVCLENTIRGLIHPQEEIIKISNYVHELGLSLHCDGARIWEVSAKTGKPIEELCEPFDSMSLCLSKGLGAPIGSVLVGPRIFINKARWFRKMFGGGIRQCGSIVSAADYCLIHHFPILSKTHQLAQFLANELIKLGVKITVPVETNHVFIDPSPIGIDLNQLILRAQSKKIRLGGSRIIIHIQIKEESIHELISLISEMKLEDSSSSINLQNHQIKPTFSPYN